MSNLVYSTPTSSSSTASIFQFHSNHHRCYFNSSLYTSIPQNRLRFRVRPTFSVKAFYKPLNPITIQSNVKSFLIRSEQEKRVCVLQQFGKPVALALFWIVLGLCPIQGFQAPANAVPRIFTFWKSKKEEQTGHQYSGYTKRLLEVVSRLLRTMEDGEIGKVDGGLQEVKTATKELKKEIQSLLDAELSVFHGKQTMLMEKAKQIEYAEYELIVSWMKASFKEDVVRIGEVEEEMEKCEIEYNEILEEIDELKAEFRRRETMSFSVGITELSAIQRETELLVESYIRNFYKERVSKLTKLSKDDIKKGLQAAQRQLWEQTILPSAVEYEDIQHPFQQDARDFAQRIKQTLEDSRDMQRNLEANIREKMKKMGDEKRSIISTPVDEIVKGYPEVRSKWTFGKKEIVIPEAASLRLFSGWKKWREEAKSSLKRDLLKNEDLGKEYVAQRQELILRDRDRVASKTWYNDERKTWEMDPVAAPFVVSRNLLESARIRHDWGAMYITLKGDDRQFYVDLKKFDMLFEDFGGFDGLYFRMIASGVPLATQVMWIPLYELDLGQQLRIAMGFSQRLLLALLNNDYVDKYKSDILEQVNILREDVLTLVVFPLIDFIIPYSIRQGLGMAWPKYLETTAESSRYLKSQNEIEMRFRSRHENFGFLDMVLFVVRICIYVIVLVTILGLVTKILPSLPGLFTIRYSDKSWKLKRVLIYTVHKELKMKKKIIMNKEKRQSSRDPVASAFNEMKRIKNPTIPLKDFSSIDSIREEINEVVAFLQNPYIFQEMGARAPRGVLIVGERGTGKTSLAKAIAAEAKVPVVKIIPQDLELHTGAGESAANVRELFRTARDLAPIIILVEDFDEFAGVRGKYIHTKNQNHESFINQLLVELDGFHNQNGVLLLATTSNEKGIDEALKRPGRIDRTFYLQKLSQAEREKILRHVAKDNMDKELIDLVDWKKVAEKTALMSPKNLRRIPIALEANAFKFKVLDYDELLACCSWFATFGWIIPTWIRKTTLVRSISRMFVNHLGLGLTKEDFKNMVDLMEPYGIINDGIEFTLPPTEWTRATKFPHAVWAAGRGLVAHLLPNFDVVENLWLEPSSWKGIGCTKITRTTKDGEVDSRSYLEKKLVFCFGSYIAAELLLPFGEQNSLSISELAKAQEIATRMVIQHGWSPDGNPAIYHYGNSRATLSMGENHRQEIAENVEKIYYLAYDKANSMLQSNRLVLESAVEALLDFDVLSGEDLGSIIAKHGGIYEKEPFSLTSVHVNEPVFRSLIENGNALSADVVS